MKFKDRLHYTFLAISLGLSLLLVVAYTVGLWVQKKNVERMGTNMASEINLAYKDIDLLKDRLKGSKEIVINKLVAESSYPYYIFRNGRLLYWSDYHLVPDYADLSGNYRFKLLDLPQGTYLSVRQVIQEEEQYEVYSIIPLYFSARINNRHIPSGYNPKIFDNVPVKIYSSEYPEAESVFYNGNHYLFSVQLLDAGSLSRFNLVLVATLLFGVFSSFLAFIYFWASHHVVGHRLRALLIVSLMLGVRLILLWIEWPVSFHGLGIFDPQNYAVSWLNPSLADLFLNVLILLLLSIFLVKHRYHVSLANLLSNRLSSVLRIGLAITISFGAWSLVYVLVSTFYVHSPYDINITTADQFGLMHVFLYFIILIGFGFYFFVNHFIFNAFIGSDVSKSSWFGGLLLGLLITLGLAFYAKVHLAVWSPFIVLMIVLGVFKLYQRLRGFSYFTFIYVFSVAIALSASSAFTVYYFQMESDNNQKVKFANKVLGDNDLLGEFLLSEINEKVKKDIFIKNRFLTPFTSKATIEQKIRRIYLNNYFERYDITIYIFNNNGLPIEKNIAVSYQNIKESFGQDKYATTYENLFLVSEKGNIQSRRYLDFIELERYGVNIGFIIIDLKRKKVIGNNVYPSLLVDRQFESEVLGKPYDYAIYENNKIVYHAGDFNYTKDFNFFWFDNEKLFSEGIHNSGYSHLAINGSGEQQVIVTSLSNASLILRANFSFFFIIQLLVILVFLLSLAIKSYIESTALNFSTKIQLYLNLSFFIPLLAVSITSMYMIISTSRKESEEEYYKKAESISQSLTEPVDLYSKNLMSREDLYTELARTTRYSDDDINIYNASGRLIATSQPLIYENNLLSDYINPNALAFIKELGFSRKILDESVGNLDYQSAYVAIRSYDTGALIGVIGIPFFSAKTDLDKQLVSVAINTLIIFSLIFIVFLLLSYFVASTLTYPLKYIANSISKISLAKENESLVWKSQDEIGLLVSEYNRMLKNLDASKVALAQSEKESAWKEMARQVAHEIKNPLTPMKLSLQHLHRMLQEGKELESHKLEKTIDTLLGQIELLNDIATSFSSFAQMPVIQNQRFDITQLLKDTAHLYQLTDGLSLNLDLPNESVWVYGDRALMSRIFSNLIINGLQAVPAEREAKIHIAMAVEAGNAKIVFRDNGNGIPTEVQDKVFLPNFSTKFTGSGIGLAIAKRGIEQANGAIWFETQEGMGTDFFIELPCS